MVEELARWKSVLTNRINETQEALKNVIEERARVRNYLIKSWNNLTQINQKICKNDNPLLKTSNIAELSLNNFKLSEDIVHGLLKGDVIPASEHILESSSHTPAECLALQVIQFL